MRSPILMCIVLPACLAAAAPAPARAADLIVPPRVAVIFGEDDREFVEDTTVFPYSAIGLVEAIFGATIRSGTGVLIGQRTVLTSAHIVHDPVLGWADAIAFTPGEQSLVEPFGRFDVNEAVALPGWVNRGDEDADLAMLRLDALAGQQTRFMRIAVQPSGFFEDLPLRSAGYPGDLGSVHMYAVTGLAVDTDGNLILHTLDTEPGQSGSPAWYDDPATDQPRLVGILKGTREVSSRLAGSRVEGVAMRITQEIANWIDDNLAAFGDLRQGIASQDIVDDEPEPAAMCGTCGAGTGQAVFVIATAWGTLLFTRRGRRG